MQQCNHINSTVRAMNMVLQLHVCHVCCRHIYYIHDVFYGASLDIEYPLLPCGKSLEGRVDLAVPDKCFVSSDRQVGWLSCLQGSPQCRSRSLEGQVDLAVPDKCFQ